jgi:hypothetical protein
MSENTETCSKCNQKFLYNKSEDILNNELVPMKIRKVVTDKEGNMVPLYVISKDKQRIVNSKYISFICQKCMG